MPPGRQQKMLEAACAGTEEHTQSFLKRPPHWNQVMTRGTQPLLALQGIRALREAHAARSSAPTTAPGSTTDTATETRRTRTTVASTQQRKVLIPSNEPNQRGQSTTTPAKLTHDDPKTRSAQRGYLRNETSTRSSRRPLEHGIGGMEGESEDDIRACTGPTEPMTTQREGNQRALRSLSPLCCVPSNW